MLSFLIVSSMLQLLDQINKSIANGVNQCSKCDPQNFRLNFLSSLEVNQKEKMEIDLFVRPDNHFRGRLYVRKIQEILLVQF